MRLFDGRWLLAAVSLLASSALLISACAPALNLATAPADESQATISSKIFGKKKLKFTKTPEIAVAGGRLDSVSVTAAKEGTSVGGSLTADGSTWQIHTSDLEFDTRYKVSATAVDLRGTPTTTTHSFRTFKPERALTITTNVDHGSTYGVGMPIVVTFNEPVTNRADIESRLQVSTQAKGAEASSTPVLGRWSWDSDTTVTYRPKKYWPGHTKVTLDAQLKGAHAGGEVYGLEDATRKFTIGSANIMLVDAEAHDMKFKRDGKMIKRMPVSTGKPGYETRSGIKVIMSKERNTRFTADVPDTDPEYYDLDIAVALRVTWSGEYLHSAPWSVGDQGNANVSHGCVNLSPSDAEWLIQNSNIGDIVEVINTDRVQDLGNGITVWNESWKEWTAGSAL